MYWLFLFHSVRVFFISWCGANFVCKKGFELPDLGLNLIVYSVCILQEAAVFAKEQDFEEKEDLHKVALLMTKLPKQNVSRPRIVIITQGAGPIILAQGTCIVNGIFFMHIKDITRV